MVISINTGKGFKAAVSYVKKEHEPNLSSDKQPEVIAQNNLYGNTQAMAKQMRFIANSNTRVSKPVMHLSINFSKDEVLSEQQRQQAVKSVLKEMGVKEANHQYFIVKHNDTKNPHYHIVLNKVDLDGQKLNLGFNGKREEFIKNRLQVIADKIEQEQGLKRTEGRNIVYDVQSKGYRFLTADERFLRSEGKTRINERSKNPYLDAIKNDIKQVLADRNINTAEAFKNGLESRSVGVDFKENSKGIYGVSFKKEEVSVKGSQLGAKWSDISNGLTTNAIMAKENAIRAYIEENSYKNETSHITVDAAIRKHMKDINPNANVWQTWKTNPKNNELYDNLREHAEKVKEEHKQQEPKEELSRFEKLKAQREEKEQDRGRSRGFRM